MRSSPAAWPPPEVSRGLGPAGDGTWRSPGYRSSWLRGRIVVALLVAVVAADAVGTLLDLRGLGLIGAAEAGTLTNAEAIAFDDLNAKVALVQLAFYLASAIGVVAWLSRVVENIPPLTGRTPARGPRAAIGWWFVPFASYVVPYLIVSDAVRRLRTGDGHGAERLLLPWWILFLIGTVTGSVLWRLPTDTLGELRAMFTLTALSDGAEAVAGILLILIIRAVEQRSDSRARGLGLGRGGPPAWPQVALAREPEPMSDLPVGSVTTQIVDGGSGDASADAAAAAEWRS